MKRILFLIVFFPTFLFSQLSIEYLTPSFQYNSISGWFAFKKISSRWEYRFYYLDSTKFQVYSSHYNGSVQYTYNFTQPEVYAGGQIYSLGIDLTGDGIVEFYVLGKYPTTPYARQSVKILNIVNNTTLLELNSTNYYYSAPTINDIDGDGVYEMYFVEYDMNNLWRYRFLVYNTNVSTSVFENPNTLKFELKQNFPNPFNPFTTIQFNLFKPDNVKLEIYNVDGQLIKTLLEQELPPGQHEVIWDGTDNLNRKVTSGVYLYRLKTNDNELTEKMVLIK